MDTRSLNHQAQPTEALELRSRLEEAEEMLRAIRCGEVDALIVEGETGPRLFTLQGIDAEQNRFRGEMLAQVSDAVIAIDCHERVTYLNTAAEQLYRVQDVLGRRIEEVYIQRWPNSEARTTLQSALRERGAWRGEAVHLTHDGRELYVESAIATLRAPDGEAIGFVAAIRDNSERHHAEESLRESESRLRVTVKNSSIVVYTTDNELRYTWIENPHPAFDPKQVIGKRDDEIMPADIAAPLIKLKRQALESGVGTRGEYAIELHGQLHWYDATVEPLHDANGDISGLTVAAMDVTERKHMEHALWDADRRKNEFLATLAHELRNPLAPVRNALHLMHMQDHPTKEMQWATEVIDRQSQHMIRLIDDLMDVSRISRGRIELKREKIELAKVILGAVETSRSLIEEFGHALIVTLPPGPVMLDADITRLTQVFMNLLTNAAKYTERGGRIELHAQLEAREVVVTVKDNGIGIPLDKLDSIFEMFSQVEDALSRSHGGLGIGLSLVQRLVDMHGGRVEAHSEGPNKGSEFVVRLPTILGATNEALRKLEPVESSLSGLRILVVDDNRDAALSLASLFESMGNAVQTAHDGEEALSVAEAFRPDVTLCDIGMPKMNGYDTCRHMRLQPWGTHMCLIALTGWGQEEDKRKSRDAGFDQHIVKPVDPSALIRVISTLYVPEPATQRPPV